MVYESKVTSKFQITIPKELREAYSVKSGGKISFIPEEDGFKVKTPKRVKNIAEKLYGIAKFDEDAVKAVHKVRSEMK